jgi:hypothetical protein
MLRPKPLRLVEPEHSGPQGVEGVYAGERGGSSRARDISPSNIADSKERIRSLDRHTSSFALSWAARGGDAVCGKLVNEIVGLAERHQ